MKMSDSTKELSWTELPQLCQKCFRVRRRLIGTENVVSKSRSGYNLERSPQFTNTQRGGGKNCQPDPILSDTLVTPTRDKLLPEVSNDAVICASLTTTNMSAAAANITCSSTNRNHSRSYSLSSVKQQSIDSYNNSNVFQMGLVSPQFQDTGSQLQEAGVPCCTVSNVESTASANMKRDSDLHRCPLCDMVFDTRYCYITCIIC